MTYVQKTRSVSGAVLRQRFRSSLAGQPAVFWQWDVSSWMWTSRLGCSWVYLSLRPWRINRMWQ